MRKKFLILSFASVILWGGFLFKAHAATLSLSPSTASPVVGNNFTVNINLDTTGAQVDGVDINALNYDPTFFQIQDGNVSQAGMQIAPGSLMSDTVYNTVATTTTSGKIYFSQVPSPGNKFQGSGVLATITFKALKTGTTPITFDFTNGSTVDANVAVGITDALTAVTNGSYTLVNPPDVTPPTVSITAPSANSTILGTVTVSANAADNIGVVGVQFKVDGTNSGAEDTVAPYSISLNTLPINNGSHTITATARDASGNTATSAAIVVTVNNPDITAPSAPTNVIATAQSMSSVSVAWTAATDNIAVTNYQIFRCSGAGCSPSVLLTTVSGTSFSDTGLSVSTVYRYQIKAVDAAGNVSAFSLVTTATTLANNKPTGAFDGIDLTIGKIFGWAQDPDDTATPITVQIFIDINAGSPGATPIVVNASDFRVDVGTHAFNYIIPDSYKDGITHTVWVWGIDSTNPASNNQQLAGSPKTFNLTLPDTTSPVVSVTSPTAAATVLGTINLTATATDNVGVVGVKFYLDAGLVGSEDLTFPYLVSLDTLPLSNSSHTVLAVARDASGNTTTSTPISFTVSNPIARQPRKIKISAASLEGVSSLTSFPSVKVEVLDSSSVILSTQTLTADVLGQYTINFQQTDPLNVSLRVMVDGYLSKKLLNVDTTLLSGPVINIPQLSAGDFNGDKIINSLDYSLLNSKWNQSVPLSYDINRDGIINSLDFSVLSNNWLKAGE